VEMGCHIHLPQRPSKRIFLHQKRPHGNAGPGSEVNSESLLIPDDELTGGKAGLLVIPFSWYSLASTAPRTA
jgi:hypothetical protein